MTRQLKILQKQENTEEWDPPDGEWGWFVVLGVAISNMFCQSLVSVFGLLFGEELESMGEGTSGAALVMNSMSMITNFSGLIIGPLIKKYSFRIIAMAGGFLTSIGLILASQSTTMWQIILSYSLFSGLGLGMLTPATFCAISVYFSPKKRSRAVGFALAGTGIGQCAAPQVIRYLLDEYGFKGTTMIAGAGALHAIAGSALFQPVKWHMKPKVTEKEPLLKNQKKQLTKQHISVCSLDSAELGTGMEEPVLERKPTQSKNTKMTLETENIPKNLSYWQKISSTLDLDLLKDPVFLNITMGLALVYIAGIYFSMVFPLFLRSGIGLDRSQIAMCMSILAGADILARVTLPTVSSYFQMSCRMTFLIGTILLGIFRSVLACQDSYTMLLVVSSITGFIRAATVINQNLTVAEYCETNKLPTALGLNMVNKGLLVLSLGQFFGWLRDYTRNFQLSIHISNTMLLLVFASWSSELMVHRLKKGTREEI